VSPPAPALLEPVCPSARTRPNCQSRGSCRCVRARARWQLARKLSVGRRFGVPHDLARDRTEKSGQRLPLCLPPSSQVSVAAARGECVHVSVAQRQQADGRELRLMRLCAAERPYSFPSIFTRPHARCVCLLLQLSIKKDSVGKDWMES
jgi:hypothetical protein